jgi:hypothetical protein
LSFSTVVLKNFHAGSNNLNVVAMVFVFNKFCFWKQPLGYHVELKLIHFSFQYWLHFYIWYLYYFNEFQVIQRYVKCCICRCVSKWHLIVIFSFPHLIRSYTSNEYCKTCLFVEESVVIVWTF